MIDSIRIGLDAIHRAEAPQPDRPVGVLVVPADMPTIGAATCQRCMAAFADDPGRIVIATHAGRRGHPIIFPLSLRTAIDDLTGGLNELPKRFPKRVHLVDTEDTGSIQDVDTPDDYRNLS